MCYLAGVASSTTIESTLRRRAVSIPVPIAGALLAIVAGVGWGAMFPIAKVALHHVAALPLTAVRYTVASAIFLALLARFEGRGALRYDGRFIPALVLGSLGFAGFNLLSYVGLGMTQPQNAALVVATMPFVTMLILRVRGAAAVPRPVLGAMVVGFLGVAAVITDGDPLAVVDGGVGAGEGLIVIGVASWALYTIGARSFTGWSPLRYTALTASAGTLTILAITAVASVAGWSPVPSAGDLGAAAPDVVYIVLIGAVVAVLAWNTAVQLLGAQAAVLFNNLVPTTAFIIALAGGYAASAWELGGALVAVGALVAANVLSRRAAPAVAR
jgi:drug/metabolite transporter (DMT)-like permease